MYIVGPSDRKPVDLQRSSRTELEATLNNYRRVCEKDPRQRERLQPRILPIEAELERRDREAKNTPRAVDSKTWLAEVSRKPLTSPLQLLRLGRVPSAGDRSNIRWRQVAAFVDLRWHRLSATSMMGPTGRPQTRLLQRPSPRYAFT